MPLYFRKTVRFGPLNVNFSKSGVGLSAGVRGLRFGVGPRGHYVRAGLGGVYYQSAFGGRTRPGSASQRPRPAPANAEREQVAPRPNRDAEMHDIESADVDQLRGEEFEGILREIETRRKRVRLAFVLPLFPAALALAVVLVLRQLHWAPIWGFCALLVVPAFALGRWIDASRRTSVLAYDLDGDMEEGYRLLCEAFDLVSSCVGKWHVDSSGAVRDPGASKRNAGATALITRRAAGLSYALPRGVLSNLTPPALSAGRQMLFFFPDVVLVEEAGRFGAIGYDALVPKSAHTRYIETDNVPTDTEVIDRTWRYVNKNGDPDRRFVDNKQLPVCAYEELSLTSEGGLNELFQFSKPGPAQRFRVVLEALGEVRRGRTA